MIFEPSILLNPDIYQHPVSNIELIETHISWVILTGQFAYKVKKPVNYGFLDFSSLERRHKFCKQELLLNQRLAPLLYLEVVSISGTLEKPILSSNSQSNTGVFEYAVKMVQFPQSAQLDNKLQTEGLSGKQIDAIALMIAKFHDSASVAANSTCYGTNKVITLPIEENFQHISDHLKSNQYQSVLKSLKQWNQLQFVKLANVFVQRKQDGFVRECHGDLHLRNMIWLEGKPMAFDCIEFNPELRWIDVLSDVAFLVMDLQDRQQYQLANRFLNTYLEGTGDYEGLSVLSFYLCYRAMVRAKVDALRLGQENFSKEDQIKEYAEFESYLKLAETYTKPSKLQLIIMRGMSASGKSTVSQQLLEKTGAIRIRSDVERKRLFDFKNTSGEINTGNYSTAASLKTYTKLYNLASCIIKAGYSVIIDAAFLSQEQRKPFQTLARGLGVPFTIVETTASTEILRQRIVKRKDDISDANLLVLEHQISNREPLIDDEINYVVSVNTEEPLDMDEIILRINKH